MLGIKIVVDPGDFVASRIEQAIGTSATWDGRWMGQDHFHNCCALLSEPLSRTACCHVPKATWLHGTQSAARRRGYSWRAFWTWPFSGRPVFAFPPPPTAP